MTRVEFGRFRDPDPADFASFVRQRGLSPAQADAARGVLAFLVQELNAMETGEEARRKRERHIAAVTAIRTALLEVVTAIESTPPGALDAVRAGLDCAHFGSMLGAKAMRVLTRRPVGSGALDPPDAGVWLSGEGEIRWDRAEQVLAALAKQLVGGLGILLNDLKARRRRGRPIDEFRITALLELLVLYDGLHGWHDGRTASADLLDFLHVCFAMIGLGTDGLDDAAARLIREPRTRWILQVVRAHPHNPRP